MQFPLYSRSPLTRINWDSETSGHEEVPDNWILKSRLHIYWRTSKTLIHNSVRVFDNWGKILCHKRGSKITVREYLPVGPSRSGQLGIRITSVRINGVLLYSPAYAQRKQFISLSLNNKHLCSVIIRNCRIIYPQYCYQKASCNWNCNSSSACHLSYSTWKKHDWCHTNQNSWENVFGNDFTYGLDGPEF